MTPKLGSSVPAEDLRDEKSLKQVFAKQKMSHVVESMGVLKLGFEVPDTRPIQGAKVERLAI